jgi:subtilisin-like proprotein convertase family protein
MKKFTFLFSLFLSVLLSTELLSQNYFQSYLPTEFEMANQNIKAKNAEYFEVDIDQLKSSIVLAPYREDVSIMNSSFFIQLPNHRGGLETYKVARNKTIHPQLNAQFPDILTFDGVNINNVLEKVKFELTPQGFHAMILNPDHSTIYVDPLNASSPEKVMVYFKKDFYSDKQMVCEFESPDDKFEKLIKSGDAIPEYGTCQLRTYRLALAATAEYTIFHGGTVALALAAQVVTMNRVNGVYERDIAITMTIIPNNNLLIYTNATTDPYTNGNASTMLTQNVTNCNAVIGAANYDIGHVFGTNSGGIAGLGVVCGTNKARGVTGSAAPVGDPFDIDYVAHEMGHQFNGNHTQNNNCNRNNATAVEPGSASTIMGYAGICAPNVQNNSDDHFHGISLSEITTLITGVAHTCPVITALSNSAPVITGTNGNVSVPVSTPFALTCTATDANNDPLTYNWEQTNNQVSTQPPVATSTSGPNFRSNPSTTSPTRYFPSLASLASNGPFTWEVVPSVARTMNFRCSVRDNSPGAGGCQDFENVTVSVVATAGPFVVNYPSATGISWPGSSNQTVTWSVANTNLAPISASTVNIYLSTDGGQSYPTLLLAGTPNDGSESISVPNTVTTTARIMVISSAGTFFDISDNNFSITASTFDYVLGASPSNLSICQGNNGVFTVTSSSLGGYSAPINLTALGLPGGAIASFVPSTINPGQSSVLTISGAPAGVHSITVEGNSGGNIHTIGVVLDVQTGSVSSVTLTTPANGAINVANPTTFSWNAVAGATYTIEISTSATFATIADQASGLTNNTYTSIFLNPSTPYFWRVNATNGCGTSPFTQASYTTGSCYTISSTNVPVLISAVGANTVTSIINIPQSGFVGSIRVPKVQGTHSYVSDLTINLISPGGTSVTLMDGICGSDDNFNLGFDDAAPAGNVPCPPTSGFVYQPDGSLNTLIGAAVQGNWTLEIIDGFNQDGGALQFWSLELCVVTNPCISPDVPVIAGPDSICGGEAATLSIASGNLNDATQWQWYTGSCGGTAIGTGVSINVNPSINTNYFVRGTGGCVTNATCANQTIVVTNLNLNVAQNGNQLSSLQPTGTYQWLLCSSNYAMIPGATSAIFTPTLVLGSYAVEVTKNGCVDTSACFTINQAGLEDLNNLQFVLSPNPSSDLVQLSWLEEAKVSRIDILDAKGKLVWSSTDMEANEMTIDLTHFEAAVYFVRITHAQGTENIKLIKTN